MELTTQKKWLYGIGAAVGLAVIYNLANGDSGGGGEDPTGNGGIPNAGDSTVAFNAKRVADALYEAMRRSGTDREDILAALRTVNQTQFGQVFTAFGLKQYNKTLGNQINPIGWFTQLPYENLKTWLKEELSSKDYNLLRLKYPNYL